MDILFLDLDLFKDLQKNNINHNIKFKIISAYFIETGCFLIEYEKIKKRKRKKKGLH